ncbi:MAG: hypothetical protein WBZ33_03240, partial [Thermoactinomyces sp.]
LWGFINFLIAAALLAFGLGKLMYTKTGGNKALALFALIVGGGMMLRWIPFLAGLAIGLFCIYYGWKLLTSDRNLNTSKPSLESEGKTSMAEVESSFEAEWNEFLNKQGQDQ